MDQKSKELLWKTIKDLTDQLAEAEAKLALYPFIPPLDRMPLSVRRKHSKMRLCYGETPVTECSVVQRIEIVKHLPEFVLIYQEFLFSLQRNGAEAVDMMDEVLKKL